MKYLILLTLASLAASAKLDPSNRYLPPNSRSSSGASAGLQAPAGVQGHPNSISQGFGQNARQSAPSSGSAQSGKDAQILRYDNERTEQGYRYAYETSDGTKVEEQANIIPGSTPEEGSLQVSGSYSYVGDDGQTYTITYTADENGFQAKGDHLPTPPPIPEEILKSLQLTAGSSSQYNNKKSSYDADAGY